MKYLAIILALTLAGCTSVPIKQKFPEKLKKLQLVTLARVITCSSRNQFGR